MFVNLVVVLALASHPSQQTATPRVWAGDKVTFLARPQPEFPDRARSNHGVVGLICTVTVRGTFNNCQIESETPEGNGFGRAAVASMHRGSRIDMRAGGPSPGDRVQATIRFWNGQ